MWYFRNIILKVGLPNSSKFEMRQYLKGLFTGEKSKLKNILKKSLKNQVYTVQWKAFSEKFGFLEKSNKSELQ